MALARSQLTVDELNVFRSFFDINARPLLIKREFDIGFDLIQRFAIVNRLLDGFSQFNEVTFL